MATETIGQRLRRLRTSKNISQDQLAEALRTTRQTVSNWENDKNAIDYFSLEDIKKILHVSWDELMADDYEEMLKRHLANVDAMSDGEKYVEKSLQHGCRWPYTDIANLSKPGDITITADDLRIAYRTASDALIHVAVAIEAKDENTLEIRKNVGDGNLVLKVKTPVLVTVPFGCNEPTLPTLRTQRKANRAEIPVIDESMVDLDASIIGKPGALSIVTTVSSASAGRTAEALEGSFEEIAARIDELVEEGRA